MKPTTDYLANKQPTHVKWSSASPHPDKRVEELKAFALEYVKQIVCKASELAQQSQEARTAKQIHSRQARELLILETAKQINANLRLDVAVGSREQSAAADDWLESATEEASTAKASKRRSSQRSPHWHQLLACLSTCFSQTLVQIFPSSRSGRAV